jgi:hypothetical protein
VRRAARWWKRALPAEPVVTCTAGPVGDDLIAALIPVSLDFVTAVHDDNATIVNAAFAAAEQAAGDDLTAARALAILCAGMCSEDHAPVASLGWTLNRDEYHRLKPGMDALTASLRAGRTQTAIHD